MWSSSLTFAMTCGAWIGPLIYAFPPNLSARCLSSADPSVVMMMTGVSLWTWSIRIRLTNITVL